MPSLEHSAGGTAANESQKEVTLGVRPMLQAGLHHLSHMGLSCFCYDTRVLDRVRQRGFAINMLPRRQGIQKHLLVLMRRRGDHYRLNLLIGQELLVIGIALRVGGGILGSF